MRTYIFSYGLFSIRKEWLEAEHDSCHGWRRRCRYRQCGESEHVISWCQGLQSTWDWIKHLSLSLGIWKTWKHATTTEEEGCCSPQRLHRALHYYGNTWWTWPMVRTSVCLPYSPSNVTVWVHMIFHGILIISQACPFVLIFEKSVRSVLSHWLNRLCTCVNKSICFLPIFKKKVSVGMQLPITRLFLKVRFCAMCSQHTFHRTIKWKQVGVWNSLRQSVHLHIPQAVCLLSGRDCACASEASLMEGQKLFFWCSH